MKLTPRLRAVAELIRAEAHADIGADHALLPRYLLTSGRARRVVVVEKHPGPYQRSRQALAGYPAEVRLGNGLSALAAGEVDSLSISGMGALAMVAILGAYPERLPEQLALQPNDSAEPLRRWAIDSGHHLSCERLVQGYWRYSVLALTRRHGPDPAYQGLPSDPALRYGPLLLAARDPLLLTELEAERVYLQALLVQHDAPAVRARLATVEAAMRQYNL